MTADVIALPKIPVDMRVNEIAATCGCITGLLLRRHSRGELDERTLRAVEQLLGNAERILFGP